MIQHQIYHFLRAAKGNWHNAVYIKCSSLLCPHGNPMPCEGFLMAMDADGSPAFLSVETLRRFSGEPIDPEECRIVLNKHTFEAVYALYVEWHTASPESCSLKLLCETTESRGPC